MGYLSILILTTQMKIQKSIIQISPNQNFQFFILVVIIEQTFNFVTATIAYKYDPSLVLLENQQARSLTYTFWLSVIIIPFIETLLFQFGIIELLLKIKLRLTHSVMISAIGFGLAHYYNIPYILSMTVIGLLFAYYYAALRHQGKWRAILLVTAVHMLANLITFFTNYVFKE